MAGGISAGRLSIEIVAEIARLQQSLDQAKRAVNAASGDIAKSAKYANDNLANIGKGAGAGLQQFSRDVAQLKSQLDPAWAATQRYKQEVALLQTALAQGAISHKVYVDQLRQSVATLKGVQQPMHQVTTAAGAQKAGMQQLSFQLSDVATQFSMGTPPMQIFAQQSGQVVQAVGLMTGGTSKLAAFLGGPWGMALTAAAVVLTPFIAKLFETASAADTARAALSSLIKKQREQAAEAASLVQSQIGLNKARERLLVVEDKLSKLPVNSAGRRQFAYALEKEQAALQWEIAEGRAAVTIATQKEADAVTKATPIVQAHTAANRAGGAAATSHTAALNAQTQAYDQAARAAKNYAEQIEDQVAKFGKSALEIQRMEVAAKAAAAPTAELAKRIREAGEALETKQIAKATADFNDMVTALYNETELSRLVGKERELRALQLEKEGKMAEWAAQGLGDLDQRWHEYAAARLYGIETKSVLERDKEAAEILLDRMSALSSAFSGLSRSGPLGDLLGVLTSRDPISSLLGMGGVGSLVGLMTGGGREAYQKQGEIIAQNISDVFGIKGPFAKTLAGALQGSALGSLGGSIIGKNNIGSQIGGALAGGLMSGGLGKSITGGLTSALGSTIGGALSAAIPVLGGVLGGLLGGLFGSAPPSGSARITNATSAPTKAGNNSALNAQAGTLAQSVQSGLLRVAEQFDSAVGDFNVAIGIYKDTIRVNYSGAATNGVRSGANADRDNFGSNSDAAVKAAIQNAIADGALQGVNPAIQKILAAGKDLELQLQKALDFQGVFDELKSIQDPVGFAVDQVEKQFTRLRKIFDEAGATVEERAKLEELYGIKLEEAQTKAAQGSELLTKRRELEIALMHTQGDVIGALAAARADELAQLDPSLRALQQMIWAAELANQKRGLEIQLMSATGDTVGAVAAQRDIELASLDQSLHAIQKQIWAAQDATAANQALAQAQTEAANAAAAAASRMASLQERLLSAQGDEAGLRAFRRAQELSEALSDAERAMLGQIYAAEDAARAAQALAEARDAQRRADEEAARAAEEIARQKFGLENQLLRLRGKEAEAVAREQAELLKTLDPSLHVIQKLVWAEQKLAEVREAATQKVEDARSALSAAYERESGALRDTIERFKDLRKTLAEFREGLFQGEGFDNFLTLQRRLTQTSALANTGQEAALRDLPKVAQDFLGAAYERATSRSAYQLEVARVAAMVDQAMGAADDVVDYNEAILETLDRSVDGLGVLNDTVEKSVAQLKDELIAAIREEGANRAAENQAIERNTGTTAAAAEREMRRPVEAVG